MATTPGLEEANQKVHPVTTQWHHPIMVARGFVPETLEAVGLVRRYDYVHPDGHRIRCTTGVNSDHWQDVTGPVQKAGYWASLEGYLDGLLSTVKPSDT